MTNEDTKPKKPYLMLNFDKDHEILMLDNDEAYELWNENESNLLGGKLLRLRNFVPYQSMIENNQ